MCCLQHPGGHYRGKEYFKVTQLLPRRVRSVQVVNQAARVELQPKNRYNAQGEKLDAQSQVSLKYHKYRPLAGAQCQTQLLSGSALRPGSQANSLQLQGQARGWTSQTPSNCSGFEDSWSSFILWHQQMNTSEGEFKSLVSISHGLISFAATILIFFFLPSVLLRGDNVSFQEWIIS